MKELPRISIPYRAFSPGPGSTWTTRGREPPNQPTLFNYVQEQLAAAPSETWVVTSNKALTSNIGVGANVILSKQLLIEAVERIVLGYSARQKLHRELLLEELTAVMQDDYGASRLETCPSASSIHDPGR